MDALIWILVSIAGIAIISYANKTTKTIVSDPRSTYGYGPDKWLKDETNISCPSCNKNDKSKNFFRKGNEKFIFICPNCKSLFEIR